MAREINEFSMTKQDDAADLRTTEHIYEIAAQLANVAFWRWSFAENRITHWSDEYARLNAYVENSPGDYGDMLKPVHEDDRERVEQVYLDADKGPTGFDVDYRIYTPDGELRWLHEHAEVEYDKDGKAVAHIGIIQDITKRKRSEDELRTAHDELELLVAERTAKLSEELAERKLIEADLLLAKEHAEVASRSKSQFLANMSHELRTPLNSIIGFSEILKSDSFGPLDEKVAKEYASFINESGKHLIQIISDILDLSKIEAGRVELLEEEIVVHEIVDFCLMMLQTRANDKQLSLLANVQDDLQPLLADEIKLKQILLNLLSNAVKFTPENGSVTVDVYHSETENKAMVLKVTDTGIGIAAEDIPKVTNPFEQIGDVLYNHKEGTGLGLTLAKRLAELHGGSLKIDSQIDLGTTITVTFPAVRNV